MGKRNQDYTGQRFGQCVVLRKLERKPEHYQPMWELLCDCGQVCVKAQQQLKRPSLTTRCPSCFAEAVRQKHKTHGETHNYLYQVWVDMNRRCYSSSYQGKKRYSGRGITVFDGWRKDYVAFATWVRENIGDKPERTMSLDRIDNDGCYVPGNIRWATRSQQRNNTCQTAADTPTKRYAQNHAISLAYEASLIPPLNT